MKLEPRIIILVTVLLVACSRTQAPTATSTPDPQLLSLLQKGRVAHNQGQYKDALIHLAQALTISREIDDLNAEATTLSAIARVYTAQGTYDLALQTYRDALAIVRDTDDRVGENTILNDIGSVYRCQSLYEQALKNHMDALAIAREIGDQAGEAAALHNIGLAENALATGD